MSKRSRITAKYLSKVLDAVPMPPSKPIDPMLLALSRNSTVLAETRGFLRNLATQLTGLSVPPNTPIADLLQRISAQEAENQKMVLDYLKAQP